MPYFLAPSLVALRDEIDARWPERDKASDGWIGDPAHSARVSSHNPLWSAPGKWSGVVQAIDVDNDGDPGQETPIVKAVLAATIRDPRVWYVIWNGHIYSRTYGWAKRRYAGSNPHDKHVHVSLVEEAAAWGDTSRWLDPIPAQEDDMPLTPADLDKIRAVCRAEINAALIPRYRVIRRGLANILRVLGKRLDNVDAALAELADED